MIGICQREVCLERSTGGLVGLRGEGLPEWSKLQAENLARDRESRGGGPSRANGHTYTECLQLTLHC